MRIAIGKTRATPLAVRCPSSLAMPVAETMEDFVEDALGETRASLGSAFGVICTTRSLWPLAAAFSHFSKREHSPQLHAQSKKKNIYIYMRVCKYARFREEGV